MTPEVSVHAGVVIQRPMPRLGRGVCWADITAEIAEDEAKRRTPAPNPWTDPEEAA